MYDERKYRQKESSKTLAQIIRDAMTSPDFEEGYQEWLRKNRQGVKQCAPHATNDKARNNARRQAHGTT